MRSNLNFKNLGAGLSGEMGGGRPLDNFPLTRQSSIYSLTFDEFQTMGRKGKDFGSMNMDELLKNIWTAEENQNIGSTSGGGGQGGNGNLQRQGSLTLPRTLSQKTVDEVWKDISKDYGEGKEADFAGFIVPQKEPTLGEVTLEEFLVRAGVVREDAQLAAKGGNINLGFFGDLPSQVLNSSTFGFGYKDQQGGGTSGLMSGRIAESSNQMAVKSANLQQIGSQHQPVQQPQLLPKQPNLGYGGTMGTAGIRSSVIGVSDPVMNDSAVQNAVSLQGGGLQGIVGLGTNGVTAVRTGSPAVSSDGLTKSNEEMSSVSPIPYVFNGGLRGRRSAALEKVVERRQKRMIKNRESAARSRARKQAYTMELEAEVAKLKEENEELQRKQAKMLEMQKNKVVEMANQESRSKRRCLRRTQTCPW